MKEIIGIVFELLKCAISEFLSTFKFIFTDWPDTVGELVLKILFLPLLYIYVPIIIIYICLIIVYFIIALIPLVRMIYRFIVLAFYEFFVLPCELIINIYNV